MHITLLQFDLLFLQENPSQVDLLLLQMMTMSTDSLYFDRMNQLW
jgi:hypothetical protein